jgi:mRNA interferase MazF
MPYRRGDVVSVPYEYSDLSGGKVRPAVVVSSDAYNLVQPDVVAAGISTQVATAGTYDHILTAWAAAGLRYPSLVRGRLLTIEQSLIRRAVGRLSIADLAAVETRLVALLLSNTSVAEYVSAHVDLEALPGRLVQSLAEKSLRAGFALAVRRDPAIDLVYLRTLLTAA